MPRIRVRCSIRVLMIVVAVAALLVWSVIEGRRLYRVSRNHQETAAWVGEAIANHKGYISKIQLSIDRTKADRDDLAKRFDEAPTEGGFRKLAEFLFRKRIIKKINEDLADGIRRRDATLSVVEQLARIQRESERLSWRPWQSVRLDPRQRAQQVEEAYFASVNRD